MAAAAAALSAAPPSSGGGGAQEPPGALAIWARSTVVMAEARLSVTALKAVSIPPV